MITLKNHDKAHIALIVDCHGAEAVVEMLASILYAKAEKAFALRDGETAFRLDRIAQVLDEMPVKFENEDSNQEERSHYDV